MAAVAEEYVPDLSMINRSRYTGTALTRVGLSVTTAKCAALIPGTLYKVSADVNWHMNQGPQGSVTATTNDFFILAGWPVNVWVTAAGVDDGIAGILDASTGNFYVKPMA